VTDREVVPAMEWQDMLDRVTFEHAGEETTIEVLDRELGDHFEAEQLPLELIEYDRKDDVVIVAVGGRDEEHPVVLRHLVSHPKQILVDGSVPGATVAVDVLAGDGSQTIVTLRNPT
jgi:hypothetical protein